MTLLTASFGIAMFGAVAVAAVHAWVEASVGGE